MSIRPPAFVAAAAQSLALVTVVGPRSARADLPPPDVCTAPGQPCQNAGPKYDQAGTCTATSCTKTVPDGDGGTTTMKYDCNLCQEVTADAGPGGGGDKSSGCSIAQGRPIETAAGALAALALLGISRGRRRRSR